MAKTDGTLLEIITLCARHTIDEVPGVDQEQDVAFLCHFERVFFLHASFQHVSANVCLSWRKMGRVVFMQAGAKLRPVLRSRSSTNVKYYCTTLNL